MTGRAATVVALVLAAAGCASGPSGTREIRVGGSDTMLPLCRRLAESYMRVTPGVAVRVSGGGTGVGVRGLVDGELDLCAASRPFSPAEVEALFARFRSLGVRYLVARDAVTVIVHPSNPVRQLSLEEAGGLFSGRIGRWSAVGGPDRPVRVVVRPPTSGTYRWIRDEVLGGGSAAAGADVVPRARDVIAAVAADPAAVGHAGLVTGPEVVPCAIDGSPPTEEAILEGHYPLSRYLALYAADVATGDLRDFLDFCLGPTGQWVVRQEGFIPLWERPRG